MAGADDPAAGDTGHLEHLADGLPSRPTWHSAASAAELAQTEQAARWQAAPGGAPADGQSAGAYTSAKTRERLPGSGFEVQPY